MSEERLVALLLTPVELAELLCVAEGEFDLKPAMLRTLKRTRQLQGD